MPDLMRAPFGEKPYGQQKQMDDLRSQVSTMPEQPDTIPAGQKVSAKPAPPEQFLRQASPMASEAENEMYMAEFWMEMARQPWATDTIHEIAEFAAAHVKRKYGTK